MTRSKSLRIGIIAEDESDVDAVKVMIRRMLDGTAVGIKHFVGKGCGRIKRKCNAWANNLKQKRCQRLILIHDLDRKTLNELRDSISNAISPCPIPDFLICIPVEEMEAWFLSDPTAIKTALNLPKPPNISGKPENIKSPKEHIGMLVKRVSKGEKTYINTKHNEKIAASLDFSKAMVCESFRPFHDFILNTP